jgi:hypothetical protein
MLRALLTAARLGASVALAGLDARRRDASSTTQIAFGNDRDVGVVVTIARFVQA